MTETGQSQNNNATNAVTLEVSAQYLKDFSFENPQSPISLLVGGEAPQVQVDVSVGASPVENLTNPASPSQKPYEVVLTVRATASRNDAPLFILDLTYAGIFSSATTDENIIQPLMMIEAPQLLFPFARMMVANITREGGFPPLLINPIDFAELYRQNAQNKAA